MSRARNLANLLNSSGDVKSDRLDNVPVYANASSSADGLLRKEDKSKLDGIEASANNYTHPANHAISVITGLQTALDAKVDDSQVLTNVPSGAVFTDTNTTYSVGDGGLTEINFTSADHSKLNGIEAGATADQTGAEILALFSNSITAGHIAAGAIGASEIGNDVVNSQHYAASSVDNEHISGMAASKLTGALPAISGANLTNLPASPSIGVGQTWQNVSRTAGVTYTNTTGRAIQLHIWKSGSGSTYIYLNGIAFGHIDAKAWNPIIPHGSTYRCDDFDKWLELR